MGENDMTYKDTAVNKFNEGFNCAQAIVFAFSDKLDTAAQPALRAATGFGAGMGRKQSVCGAVTGGIIVLGVLLGRGTSDGPDKQEEAYAVVRWFMDGFEKKFGTTVCGRLLDGCELLTPEGQARFKAENLKERCCGFVAGASELLEKIITENGAGG
jgi:C_GCAxxG_C_C family probable redox protein